MTIKNKKSIAYGKVHIPSDAFNSRNVKIRVTTMLDLDAVEKLRELATKRRVKYQTLLNQIVRNFVFPEENSAAPITRADVLKLIEQEFQKRAA